MMPYIRILPIHQQKHHECICQSNQIVHQLASKHYQLMSKTKQTLANGQAFVFYLMGHFSHWLIQKLLGANTVVSLEKWFHCWCLGNKVSFFCILRKITTLFRDLNLIESSILILGMILPKRRHFWSALWAWLSMLFGRGCLSFHTALIIRS